MTEILETQNVSMEQLSIDENLPEASPHAIEAFNKKVAEENEQQAQLEAENVKLKKDGTPAKKRGRKPGSANSQQSKLNIPGSEKTADNPIPDMNSIEAATVISKTLEQLQVSLISQDFRYNELESAGNIAAWNETINYYGGLKVHPVAALALSHTSIILARMGTSNETRTKIELFKAWAKNKFVKIFKRKKNALPDTGNDTERKNDMGKKESGGFKKADK